MAIAELIDYKKMLHNPNELLSVFPDSLADIKRNFEEYDDKIRGCKADFIVEVIEAKVLFDGLEQEILLDSLRSDVRAHLIELYRHYFRLKALLQAARGVPEKTVVITPEMIETARAVPCDAIIPNAQWIERGCKRRCLCPLHVEKTPSFFVNTDENRWNCFGSCGRGGDAIDLWRALHGGTFTEAVRALGGVA